MSTLDFQVEHGGQDSTLDEQHLAAQLKGMGYDIAGISSDGMTFTMNEPGPKGQPQQYQVKTPDILKTMGYTVKGIQPANSDKENIDSGLSAMLHQLPEDDDMRKSFIEAKMRHRGIQDPQVTGGGGQWHVFNPSTSQWIQMTDKPGFDLAGAESAAMQIPRFAGMAIGGTAGAAAGTGLGGPVGGVAGGLGGAGLGSAAGQALTQGGLSLADEDFRHALGSNMGASTYDVAKTAAMDAPAQVVGGALSKFAPVSKILQTGGKALGALGSGVSSLSEKILGSEGAQRVVSNLMPYIGDPTFYGEMAQLPAAAVKGLAKIPGRMAESDVFSPMLGGEEANQAARQLSSDMLTKRTPRSIGENINAGAEELASRMGRQSTEPGEAKARDVLGNIVGRRQAATTFAEDAGWQEQHKAALDAAREWGSGAGMSEEAIQELMNQSGSDLKRDAVNAISRQQRPNWGEQAGSALDSLANAGRGVEQAGMGLTRGALRTGYAGGLGAKALGNTAATVGTLTEPLEMPLLTRYGAPHIYNWWEDKYHRGRRTP